MSSVLIYSVEIEKKRKIYDLSASYETTSLFLSEDCCNVELCNSANSYCQECHVDESLEQGP